MDVEVTKNFAKQYEKLTPNMQAAIERAFAKLAENPASVRFEEKVGTAKGIFSMRLDGNFRVAFTKNADGNFVPCFVGNHNEYDRFLSDKAHLRPENLLGANNERVRTISLNVPESLSKNGILGHTSFAIGNIKLHGVVGFAVSSALILALGGTPRDAIAATTPGHVGLELNDGNIRGATEALVVDGSGDGGCVAVGAAGLRAGATVGAFFEGVGAVPGAAIGAIGGCIVGSIAASTLAQSIWDHFSGDEKADTPSPKQIIDELKALGIDRIPDQVTENMPHELKDLVVYKKEIVSAVDELNQAAKNLSENPNNPALKEAYIQAADKLHETAESYKYGLMTMDNPETIAKLGQQSGSSPALGTPPPSQNAQTNNYSMAPAP